MATCVRSKQSKGKLETLALSNNTAKLRIHDLSTDVSKQQVSCDLNPACFFIATRGTNRLSGLAAVLGFGRHLFQNKIEEDLLPKCAVLQLLPVPQLIWEVGFSSYAATRSKYGY
jgi:hypothetical protein